MKLQIFSFFKSLKSFTFAVNGLKILFKEENNARIHLLATILVVLLGFILKINIQEWMLLSIAIALVLGAEAINSSIENLADFITEERNEKIKKVKDLSAAAVFICAIIALFIGLLIFIPKIIILI